MKRREFITLLAGSGAGWPLAAVAQQRAHVIGILAAQALTPIERFRRKLRDYGYIDGQNVRLVSRFAEGQEDRYPAMAAELVTLPVDLIVTWGTPATFAAKRATGSIPVVMAAVGDPVSVGIVSNLARPEANITGFATQNVDLDGKRLELLKDLFPHLSRVGMLVNASNPLIDASLLLLRNTAEQLHIELQIFDVHNDGEIESTLQRLNKARPDGVLVAPDGLLREIADFLGKNRLPAVYPFREYAEAGA